MESLQVLTDEQQEQVCGGGAVTTGDRDYPVKLRIRVYVGRLQVRLERRIERFLEKLEKSGVGTYC